MGFELEKLKMMMFFFTWDSIFALSRAKIDKKLELEHPKVDKNIQNHAQSTCSTTFRHRNNHLSSQLSILFEIWRFCDFRSDPISKNHQNSDFWNTKSSNFQNGISTRRKNIFQKIFFCAYLLSSSGLC